MPKCRISVSFDEKNFYWIVLYNGKLIKNPTKEDLMGTKLKHYNKTNICPICREDKEIEGKELTDKSILYPKNARHDIDKNGKMIYEYVCMNHYIKHYRKYDPNSDSNIIKSLADRRTGNLSDHQAIFADNCQKLTCEIFEVSDLNKKSDNYSSRYDHDAVIKHISIMIGEKLVDLCDKILQTKGARLTIRRVGILKYEKWATNFTRELTKNFDYLIFYCASRDGKTIEIMYIIPKFEIYNTNVHIYKNPKYATERWYEKYRVIDEELIKKANEIWKKIIES